MYITFYTAKNKNIKQITFKDILDNPYMLLPKQEVIYKKVTTEITDEYGLKLFNKKSSKNFSIPGMIIKHTEIMNIDTNKHYRHFEIPKKSDPKKKRPIDAPDSFLSNLQSAFKIYIEEHLSVLPHKAAHAYVNGKSTVTAMQEHQNNNSKWYLQIDLKNFFNSINEEFLRRSLLEVYPFKFIESDTFDEIIHCALLNNELPQGSHLSPTLTNLVMVPIDYKITETLNNYNSHHYVYTRYADDITISSKQKFNPGEILNIIKTIFKEFNVPFKINNDKTRFGSTAGRNYHLGICMNNHGKNKTSQMSIGHEKNKRFRAMIFNFCTTSDEWSVHDVQKMLGLISYYKSIEKPFIERTINKYNEKFNMDIMAKAKELIK